MATKAQIKANCENAKKSTGPRTSEGKARVSLNALKHGLLARISHRFPETGLAGARDEIFMVLGRHRLSVGPS